MVAAPPGRGPARLGDSLAHLVAIWFGCGLVPRMPGTAGTLGALPLYWLVYRWGPLAVGAASLVLTLIAVLASARVVQALGSKDPQVICVDEVAGVFIALTAAPPTAAGVISAVVLFRVLDMTKPWPARALEKLPGGWGVVLDDVAAGVWAALLVVGARALSVL